MSQNQNQLPTMDQLLQLIQDVLSGNNQKIQFASQYLKSYLKVPESVGPLTLIVSQNQNVNIRQLAAVLLKKSISSTFESLDQSSKKELQMILLERFFAEEIHVIRKQLGSIIGNIAQVTLSKNEWSELMVILGQQTDQNQPLNRRKSGLELLGFILEYSGDSLQQYYGSFYNFFKLSIQDTNKNIRIETVKCLISLFDNIGYMTKEHTVLYKDLIPPIIQIVDNCIKEEDEETVQYCLNAFNYLADSKLTILDDHFLLILQFLASENVLLNKKLSKNLKECVMDIIQTISVHHRNVFNKNHEIIKQIITTLTIVISQPFTAEEIDDNEESLQDVGLWLVQNLSLNLNKKKIYGILIDMIQKLIDTQEPNKQNTAFLLLAYMCEGLSDQLSRNLQNPIMNLMVPQGLNSPHPEVRGAVIKALSYFAEYMPDEISSYHALIIPAMIQSFNDVSIKVAEKSLFTLDIFCDVMQEDIVTYLELIVQHVLQVPYNQNATMMMKRAAISTLASCISSSKEQFKIYLDRSYQTLHLIIQLKQTPENLGLVAEGVTALGQIANIFCKLDQQVYNIVIQPCMEIIYQMLINNKDYEIREGCFSFFYNLAEGIGKDFEPFFDKLIGITLEISKSEEGLSYLKKGNEFSLDSDSDDEQDSQVNVKSTFLDEKASAIHAMGQFANSCPLKFANYFQQALAILEDNFNYFNDNVRKQSLVCYRFLIEALVKCSYNGELPKYKRGLPCVTRLPQNIDNIICIEIWQKFLYYLSQEKNAEIVAITIDSIEICLQKIGPAYIDVNLDDLVSIIEILLEGRGICQHAESEEEDEIQDEETVGKVFESIVDLIPTLGKILQEGFQLSFTKIHEPLMQYLDKERDINDNIQGVGCYAVLFKKCPCLIQQYINDVLPVLLDLVESGDDELNRNIAFALGIIAEKGKQYIQEKIPYVMLALKNIFDKSKIQEAKDNAAAALCRVICSFSNQVPMEQALSHIISIAPFRGDEGEEKTLLKCLVFLAETNGNLLHPHLLQVSMILIDGLVKQKKYKLKQDLQLKIIQLLKVLAQTQENKQIIEQLVFQLSENDKQLVIALLQ